MMAALDDPTTLGRARLSFADQHDIDEFVATLEKFERGEIGPNQWRAFRLVRATYGQRQDGDVRRRSRTSSTDRPAGKKPSTNE